VDKGPRKTGRAYAYVIHPLPLLTAEGNGRGGGDYRGNYNNLCGIWSRDSISVANEVPEGYTALECNFRE
jgi:hypothetical protein